MKIKNILTAAMLGVFALTACKKDPVPTPPASDLEIKLNASLYSFTKATDTAFEANDAVGVNIFKAGESYIHNAKFTAGNGSTLNSTTKYTWYPETEVEGTIVAYYPYADIANGTTTHSFAVKADQSSKDAFKASDFMLATTTRKIGIVAFLRWLPMHAYSAYF